MTAPELSIVIPVFNEEGILVETVRHLADGLPKLAFASWELIICENGSTDATAAIAALLVDQIPGVRVISLPDPDYGAAMRAGFLAAEGASIVNFDADYYDLEFLSKALQEHADIVIAAKQIGGAHDARVLGRRVASRLFGRLVRSVLGVSVRETHGMKLYRRHVIEELVPTVVATNDLFDTELIARAERLGYPIVELPIHTTELRHSRTGILRRVPRTLLGLLRIRRELRGLAARPGRPNAQRKQT